MNLPIQAKILDVPDLLKVVAEHRAAGRTIVQCHGCFDVVHPGHIRHLSEAAEHGDILVVSVTADRQIDKGRGRPLVPQELRCENLAALTMVDYVVVDPHAWAGPLLEQIRPEAYVKGLEYATNNDPRFLQEKEIVERHGGVVVFTSGAVVYSSTRLQREQLDEEEFHDAHLKAFFERHHVSRRTLTQRLRAITDLPVIVVGDALLDQYVECEQGGVTAEAPVLQVTPIDEQIYLGGACVIALHAANLGAKVRFVGFLPETPLGGLPNIREALEARGITVRAIPVDQHLVKTRYLVEGQKVFKVDRCRPLAVSSAQENQWKSQVIEALSAGSLGLIAADFGYGAVTRHGMRHLSEAARKYQAKLFGDTSSNRYASLSKFELAHCDCVFPSESEARAYLGEPELGLPLLASELFARQLSDAVALTLGPRGLVLFEQREQSRQPDGSVRYLPEYLPSLVRFPPTDPLGAGDALTTVASLGRLAGASLVEAVVLGSIAAAIIVQRLGNEPISLEAMVRFIERYPLFPE